MTIGRTVKFFCVNGLSKVKWAGYESRLKSKQPAKLTNLKKGTEKAKIYQELPPKSANSFTKNVLGDTLSCLAKIRSCQQNKQILSNKLTFLENSSDKASSPLFLTKAQLTLFKMSGVFVYHCFLG